MGGGGGAGGVSISTTVSPTGVGPFCYGQITWEDGASCLLKQDPGFTPADCLPIDVWFIVCP